MRRNSVILPFLQLRASNLGSISSSSYALCSSGFNETLISIPNKTLLSKNSITWKLFSNGSSIATTAANFQYSNLSLQFQRTLCSSSGPSNIVPIKSEEEFNSSMKDVLDKSLPAIFYFTAVWCGPCRFISPVIAELSQKYPHVTTYKIDIDQAGLESTLSNLRVTAVPTFQFFQNGKMATEIVGADVARLKDTVEELYGQD